MALGRSLIAAVLFLGVGIWVLFAWCHGTIGFSFGYPLSGNKFNMEMTTIGIPMLVGLFLALLGLLLFLIAFVTAVVAQFRAPKPLPANDLPPRRGIPFEE